MLVAIHSCSISEERRLTHKIRFGEIFNEPIIHTFRIYFHPVDVKLDHFQALLQCTLAAANVVLFEEIRDLRNK